MKLYIPNRIVSIVFAIIIALFGMYHFINANELVNMVPIVGGKIWVYISGISLIAYAISVFINHTYEKLAGYLLALLLILVIIIIHLPLAIKGNTLSILEIMKDIALACGAIVIANQADMN